LSVFDLQIVLFSAMLHAGWSLFIKRSKSPLAFNVLQALPTVPIALALLPWAPLQAIPPRFWGVLAIACIAHALYFYWLSRAFEETDLSVAYPIARSTPAFLPLFAAPLLGESISLLGALGIAIVVGGMWLVQTGGSLRWEAFFERGTSFAYLTLAMTIVYGLSDKAAMSLLRDTAWDSPMPRAVFYYFAVCAGCTLPFTLLALRRTSLATLSSIARSDFRWIATAVVVGMVGYGLILEALTRAPASYVVAVRQASVIFVLVLSVVFLKERPAWLQIAGACATVLGVAILGIAG